MQCLIGNGVVLALDALVKEADALVESGVPVFERLRVSPGCPLILPSHVALDAAREKARGAAAIGTTGRGIGPAYEDKVSRRALRVSDLFVREKFAAKLGEILDYHNFLLKNYFKAGSRRFRQDARRGPGLCRDHRARNGRRDANPPGPGRQRRKHPVRGRTGQLSRHRPRHIPVRDVVEYGCRRCEYRHGRRAAQSRLRARYRQGLHDAGRSRSVSDRAVR